jgi:hypothetical protein
VRVAGDADGDERGGGTEQGDDGVFELDGEQQAGGDEQEQHEKERLGVPKPGGMRVAQNDLAAGGVAVFFFFFGIFLLRFLPPRRECRDRG